MADDDGDIIFRTAAVGDDDDDSDGLIMGGWWYTEELNIGHMYGAGVAITQQQLLVVVQPGRWLANVSRVVVRVAVAAVLFEDFFQ